MNAIDICHGDEDSDFELDDDILAELHKAENNSHTVTTSSIKDELRLKIQQRRISEGQGELKVEFEIPKSYELSPEEREKVEKRKHRNRQSANASRIKRQRKLENLLKDEKDIIEENLRLRTEVDSLKKFKVKLETILDGHLLKCKNNHKSNAGKIENFLQESYTVSAVEKTDKDTRCDVIHLDAIKDNLPCNFTDETNLIFNNTRELQTTNGVKPPQPKHLEAIKCSSIVPSSSIETTGYSNCGNVGVLNTEIPLEPRNVDPVYFNTSTGTSPVERSVSLSGQTQSINGQSSLTPSSLDRSKLRNLSKEQKIALLKAYLKGNQYNPKVQTLIGKIDQMTRPDRTMQKV